MALHRQSGASLPGAAGHKDYLFRVAVNATVPVQIMTDIGTEFIVSFIGFILDFFLIFFLKQCIVDILPPQFPRKEVGIYDIVFEIIADRSCFGCGILPGNRSSFLLGNRSNGKRI